MNQVQTAPAEMEGGASTSGSLLADRMDQSIGEASSVMGALLTELLRRALRGGVAKVGEQIDGFVAEKVDGTIAQRLPGVEQAASAAADRAARVAADEVAQRQCSALAEQ